MFDKEALDRLARKLADAVPDSLQQVGDDLHKNFHAILQGAFSNMSLVTRQEFDVQNGVLLRTREKLEALEKQVAELEARLKQG